MTKRDLVIKVAEKTGFTQSEVLDVAQAMLDDIAGCLTQGDRVEVRNFGVFEVRSREARLGRNPRTGDKVPIPQKSIAAFKPGKALKERVQNYRAGTPSPDSPTPPFSAQ